MLSTMSDLPFRSSSNINLSDLRDLGVRRRTELVPALSVDTMKWVALCRVGAGGYSEVFHVIEQRTQKSLAMKWVRIEQSVASKQSAQSLFKCYHFESELLSKLDHRNVLSYFGRTVAENEMMLYLELAPCGNLLNVLSIHGPFCERLMARFSVDVLSALNYLHSLSIVHRDIKASNLLVMADGALKISDFGASCRFNETTSEQLDTQGTYNWMAPEVISFTEHTPYGLPVDIWSFGCTLIEMASGGVAPWTEINKFGPPLMFHIATFPETPAIPRNLSESATSFIAQHLVRNAEDRPTASDLLKHPFFSDSEKSKVDGYDDSFQSLLVDLTMRTYRKHNDGLLKIRQNAEIQEKLLVQNQSIRQRQRIKKESMSQTLSLKGIEDFDYGQNDRITPSPSIDINVNDEAARNEGINRIPERAKHFLMRLENDRDST